MLCLSFHLYTEHYYKLKALKWCEMKDFQSWELENNKSLLAGGFWWLWFVSSFLCSCGDPWPPARVKICLLGQYGNPGYSGLTQLGSWRCKRFSSFPQEAFNSYFLPAMCQPYGYASVLCTRHKKCRRMNTPWDEPSAVTLGSSAEIPQITAPPSRKGVGCPILGLPAGLSFSHPLQQLASQHTFIGFPCPCCTCRGPSASAWVLVSGSASRGTKKSPGYSWSEQWGILGIKERGYLNVHRM